ncbi:hypothetical protein F8M41_007306 [Gigaspora margarita]|uniref:Uncharacterized protein n=1 Tax=Gigaspora margarita TaxID=4874 RepID=A0A8H3X548_GIGMA|nr:hypothetical protein F8M41_007306 [Gigaspora margarita]
MSTLQIKITNTGIKLKETQVAPMPKLGLNSQTNTNEVIDNIAHRPQLEMNTKLNAWSELAWQLPLTGQTQYHAQPQGNHDTMETESNCTIESTLTHAIQ